MISTAVALWCLIAVVHGNRIACNKPLGMKDGRILDSQISTVNCKTVPGFPAGNARLDHKGGCCIDTKNSVKPVLVIDFQKNVRLTGIDIQGLDGKEDKYVSKLMMQYLTFDVNGALQVGKIREISGTFSKNIPTHTDLSIASTFKVLIQPTSWYPKIYGGPSMACLRVEFYGCEVQPSTAAPPTTKPEPRSCKINNGGCNHKCHDVNGTISCSCKPGFKLGSNGKTCADINECDSYAIHGCNQRCRNTPGSYQCECKDGFKLQKDGRTCKDINECEIEGQCIPLLCPKEHKICINKPGSFECGCEDGYELEKGYICDTCEDINECQRGTDECAEICNNNPGSYTCSCPKGKILAPDGKNCLDVNECNVDNGGCDHKCHNDFGSYHCSCKKGFRLNRDQRTCSDVDECAEKSSGCSHTCENTVGSFKCLCPKGLKLGDDERICLNVNECELGGHECEQKCVDTFGSFKCACELGYRLNGDGKTCSDINECKEVARSCDHDCNNTIGSYQCLCRKGFKLADNKRSCLDVDECIAGTHKCDPTSSQCSNLHGSYECRCIDGFKLNVVSQKCERIKCIALQSPVNGYVKPYTCRVKNGREFQDKCNFHCDDGYKLNKVSASQASCNKDGYWSLSPKGSYSPMCEKLKCKKLDPIPNGDIIPNSCKTDGAQYQGSCNVFCNPGHDLVGNGRVTCLRTGDYDSKFGSNDGLICVKKAAITCPKDFTVVLPEGQSTMKLDSDTVTFGLVSKNKVTSYPRGVLEGKYDFKVGRNVIEYTATNEAGKVARCVFHVNVLDKEAPKVSNCDVKDIYVNIKSDKGLVEWKKPVFTDNVKVATYVNNMDSGRVLSEQVYFVYYAAADEEGNKAVCRFFVHVRAQYCDKDLMPGGDGGIKNAFPSGSGTSVILQCPPNLSFSANSTKMVYRCDNGIWADKEIPDCVPFKEQNGTCAKGSVPVNRLFPPNNICVECPRGTFQDGYECKKCPLGHYQDQTGSESCNKCPDGKITGLEGAKSLESCHVKCGEGEFSSSGLSDSKCQRCPKGSFNTLKGQETCSLCPMGGDSEEGSLNEDSCRLAARVEQVKPATVTELFNKTITVECKATGSPLPDLTFERIDAQASSRMSVKNVATGNKYINAIQMVITNAQPSDAGQYRCVASNIVAGTKERDERNVMVLVKDA